MDRQKVRKVLCGVLRNYYIFSDEYQDKYFLYKEIQIAMPEIKEDKIYEAIDYANRVVKPPRKTKKFIEAFAEKISV